MAIFTLKRGDTRPILEVALLNPDGTAHSLAGTTAWKLHVRLSPTSIFTRDMVKEGADAAGLLRYTWVASDWAHDPANTPPGLPTPVRLTHPRDLEMEYEVISNAERLTFPSGGYDRLHIIGDVVPLGTYGVSAVTLGPLTCVAAG